MRAERILLVHNRYLECGGEDAVFEAEGRLLEQFGHKVRTRQRAYERLAAIRARAPERRRESTAASGRIDAPRGPA